VNYIFYDTETTGLKAAFDQIVQFAAIVTDDQFNVLEELNLRCRLRPHQIASPGAMRVTQVGPKTIQSAPLSNYEMARQVRKFIERWSPAVVIGHNSISFDENMLRQMFFQGLHPTYLTNTNGNTRMDILRLAHAIAEHRPDAITVPLNDKGKPSFRLGHLIAANGLSLHNAHDALADTRATLVLAKFLKEGAPQVWDDLYACRSRHTVEAMLKEPPLCLATDRAFKKPTILAGAIVTHPNNPAAVAVFDLEYDQEIYLDADQEGIQRVLKASPRPIRVMKSNALPIVAPFRGQALDGVDPAHAQSRLDRIRDHPTFAETVAKAMAAADEDYEASNHVEESIYSGFPSRRDQKVMEDFHRVPWPEKYALLSSFDDRKYQEFGERIIYAEFPECLPAERHVAMQAWHRERHLADDVPWLTVKKAQEELAALKSESGAEEANLLLEIEEYRATMPLA
jgi:exodeoxyribonuclease I